MYYLLSPVQKKTTIQKANAEAENMTSRSGQWLPQSQDKHSYYNNSAVPLPLLSYVTKGQQIIIGSTKERSIRGWPSLFISHKGEKSYYARAWNSKAL